jgi:protein SCO1/2
MKAKQSAACASGGAMAVAAVLAVLLWAAPVAAENPWGAQYFPNVPLTTQNGESVHFYDLIQGKIVAIELMYTSCQYSCPLETARLAQVHTMLGDRMGKDVFFYSITIDPQVDTPKVLKAYADQYHAGAGWTFLTGKKEDIDLLSKKLGLYSRPSKENKDGHMPTLLMGNEKTGQWIRGSALDNPRLTTTMIDEWVSGYKARPMKSYAEARPLPKLERGQYLFTTKCSVCHTIGGGDKIGPDLAGVTAARDPRWLARYIAAPQQLLAERDPVARALFTKYKQVRMPNLNLIDAEVADVLAYLTANGSPVVTKTATRGTKEAR